MKRPRRPPARAEQRASSEPTSAPREHARTRRKTSASETRPHSGPPREPAAPPRSRGQVPQDETQKVYGLSAVLAVMAQRPEQVLSIAHTRATRHALANTLREAARRRIAYREVDDEELARIAGSLHHEGVCLLAVEPREPELAALASRTDPAGIMVALDGVQNPHNVGAILRSAAFFGAAGLLLGGQRGARAEGLPPAALRVAEGGAEHVGVLRVPELMQALAELKRSGLRIVGADAHAQHSLAELRWPARAVLVLGSEAEGLRKEVLALCDVTARIVGRGAIESLNVSVAAGVMLASYAASLSSGSKTPR
ncbi:MAG TPA: RNA methyltransferase [Polyangiaceae bacterium]|nr:RNA methyltransferase [Polyangiaceae bacterium]